MEFATQVRDKEFAIELERREQEFQSVRKDTHYEFLWEDFYKLIIVWGGEDNFLNNMKAFFAKEQPYYIFSDFLDENEIKYKRIVFY